MPWVEHWSSAAVGELEQCTGCMTGAVHLWSTRAVTLRDEGDPWRQEWNNALEGEMEQCHGGST